MLKKRRHIAIVWLMLFTAIGLAVPRTWIHHCSPLGESHALHDDGDHHDKIDHGTCPICDFAAAPSLEPIAAVVLLAPDWVTADEAPAIAILASRTIPLADLRGPPAA
ncbi:MAG TPA: DUF2946 family protein [Bacteroidia bacterium]|jgi:hypothetical protein|nr:DUF2946 family protein [Bacteroidia bacterium]